MSNLYARLVMGEDETTEALADLLERVLVADRERNTARFKDFISKVLLGRPTSEGLKDEFLGLVDVSPARLSVRTQYRISEGTIPDLVIFRESDPVCVVEVKIDAPIGKKQLEGYGKWLKERAADRYQPVLVLLTQATAIPREFTDPADRRYEVSLRGAAFWSEVAEWFWALCRAEHCEEQPLKSLAREFAEFLREDAMPTLDDAAIARSYLSESRRRLTEAVTNMHTGFEYPEGWKVGGAPVENPVSIWRYHYPKESDGTRYIYCGLCFKPVDPNDGGLYGYKRYANERVKKPRAVDLGDGFYAFVCIWAKAEDCKRVPGFSKNKWYEWRDGALEVSEVGLSVASTGWWHYTAGEGGPAGYARVGGLQELLDEDGRMGSGLRSWTHEALKQTQSLWSALFAKDM